MASMARRARPMSAKPAAARPSARPEFAPSESDEDEEDGFIHDDEEEEDDEDPSRDAIRNQLERVMAQPAAVAIARFRPASAPPVRAKPVAQELQRSTAHGGSEDVNGQAQSAAAVSRSYLRVAADKKKARDREFALELRREESEYRKKIAQKIEQANKLVANAGGSKVFTVAPTREGAHMVRVSDPPKGDRVFSVEIFLREFEKLASVPLGQASSFSASASASASNRPSNSAQSQQQQRSSERPASAVSRLRGRPPVDADDPQASKRPSFAACSAAKPTDRSLVQEELKSVLAGTVALAKVLQDQLHELKLKGWNVNSRAGY